MIVENNEVFYFEGDIADNNLHIYIFQIQPKYRGKKMSYYVWKQIQEKYKMDISLEAFFTLIPYYTKMGFKNLGVSDDQGYYDFILKYSSKPTIWR